MKISPAYPIIIALLFLVLTSSSCKKPPKFSDVPAITFQSIDKIENDLNYDDKALLKIHFQDGDGDIGLDDNDFMAPFDTSSVYFYNWFIDFYEKQNGQLVKINVNNNARIPRLSNTYPESIEGDLSIEVYINNYFSPYDTVVLECAIVDRKLQHSNTVRTPEIIVKKH